jgi:hypothetical protein
MKEGPTVTLSSGRRIQSTLSYPISIKWILILKNKIFRDVTLCDLGRILLKFRKNALSPSSVSKYVSEHGCRTFPTKHQQTSTMQSGVISQMMNLFTVMDVKTVDFTFLMLSSIYTWVSDKSPRYLALGARRISRTVSTLQAVIKLITFNSLILRLLARVGIETETCWIRYHYVLGSISIFGKNFKIKFSNRLEPHVETSYILHVPQTVGHVQLV